MLFLLRRCKMVGSKDKQRIYWRSFYLSHRLETRPTVPSYPSFLLVEVPQEGPY